MKFKMNDLEWTIKYATADEVKAVFNDTNPDSYYFGSATMSTQTILINREASKEKQRETLYHELMHCFLYEYGHNQNADKSFSYDDVCEVSACSHDMIHEIVEEYFKPNVVINVDIDGKQIAEGVYELYSDKSLVTDKYKKKR